MKMKTRNYLEPHSTQTLREGIAELRRVEGADADAAEHFAPELLHDIDTHDAIHVLFACPTTLAGEIIAHVWTAFGTTASLHDMHRVNAHRDHRAVLAQIGHARLLRTWLKNLPRIVTTLLNSHRMTCRWPVEEMSASLDRRLCDLRAKFGIRLPKPPRAVVRADESSGGAALRTIRKKVPSLSAVSH